MISKKQRVKLARFALEHPAYKTRIIQALRKSSKIQKRAMGSNWRAEFVKGSDMERAYRKIYDRDFNRSNTDTTDIIVLSDIDLDAL